MFVKLLNHDSLSQSLGLKCEILAKSSNSLVVLCSRGQFCFLLCRMEIINSLGLCEDGYVNSYDVHGEFL